MASKFFVDLRPLRVSRDFRLLFVGQTVSVIGNAVSLVAIPYQTYLLTHSSLQVGLVALAQLIPYIFGSLWGGAYGDAHDRKLILVFASAASAVTAFGLTANAAMHPQLWMIYVVGGIAGFFFGFANPARASAIPMVVEADDFIAANALNQLTLQIGAVLGPALAGFLIASIGLEWTYAADGVSFVIYALACSFLRPLPPELKSSISGFRAVRNGFSYLRGRPIIQAIYLMDLDAMIFGAPTALFPALASETFHVGPTGLGILYAGPAVGALVGALAAGALGTIERRGRAVVIAIVIWGAAITAFGFSTRIVLAVLFLAIAGWADVISAVMRNTMLQIHVPDEFRGRLNSFQMAVVIGGPRLGSLESGSVAAVSTPQFAAVSGGVACIVGALALARAYPAFWRELPPEKGTSSTGNPSSD